MQEKCGIPKPLGSWVQNGAVQDLVYDRWFAGYFTTARGGWFFESDGAGCGEKAYTLVSSARTPEELPVEREVKLRKMISSAIDVVNSIHYKRCAPITTQ